MEPAAGAGVVQSGSSTTANSLSIFVFLSYGLYGIARGALYMFWPCWSACEGAFVSHINQSGATSQFAIGLLAASMLRRDGQSAEIVWTLCATTFVMCVLDFIALRLSIATPLRWWSFGLQAAWTISFAWIADRASTAPPTPRFRLPTLQRWLSGSFAAFTLLETALWLLAPGQFAALVGVSSAIANDAGQTRGATDLAVGLVGWLLWRRRSSPLLRSCAIALCVFNLLLLLVGLQAQFSSLASAKRWPFEIVHAAWAIGFAYVWFRWPKPVRVSPMPH